MRLWESVIHLQCSSIQQKHLLVTFTHTLAPSSAAWRHFRNSALLLCPSLLRWLHGKQTCSKENPCSLPAEREKRVWLTPEAFFMASPCFVSRLTFHLSRSYLSHPVPDFSRFHCNQGSYYRKCSAHQHNIFWLTTGCNHLTQNLSKWVSGNSIPDHLLLQPNLQLVILLYTPRTRVLWLLFQR